MGGRPRESGGLGEGEGGSKSQGAREGERGGLKKGKRRRREEAGEGINEGKRGE